MASGQDAIGLENWSTPAMQMTSDGQTLAAVLDRIVESVGRADPGPRYAWILDREVDPNTAVSLQASGPTAGHVIAEVCRQTELNVVPWERTLIIGRSDWTAGVLHALSELRAGTNQRDVLSRSFPIKWSDGVTPRSIVASVANVTGSSHADASEWAERLSWLPHDHWRSKTFQANRLHVVSLVLAQFGWRLKTRSDFQRLRQMTNEDPSKRPDSVVDLDPDSKVSYQYPVGDWLNVWKGANTRLAKSVRVRAVDSGRLILAEPSTHLMLVLGALASSKPAANQVAGANPSAVFDLELLNKPAVTVLNTLAQAGQLKLEIDPNADLRSRALVSLSAKKASLRDLIQKVCDEAGLVVNVSDTTIQVRLGEPE